jgi:hypothetical protein
MKWGCIPAGPRDFSLSDNLQTGSEAHLTSYAVGARGFPRRVKQQEHEVNHSPPSSSEVTNGRAIHPVPHNILLAWCLIIQTQGPLYFSCISYFIVEVNCVEVVSFINRICLSDSYSIMLLERSL